jgi:hypothetical protein
MKENTDIEQLIIEQNYQGVNIHLFNSLIDELQINESLDDLLNMFTK